VPRHVAMSIRSGVAPLSNAADRSATARFTGVVGRDPVTSGRYAGLEVPTTRARTPDFLGGGLGSEAVMTRLAAEAKVAG
jgi:hypothetical protein